MLLELELVLGAGEELGQRLQEAEELGREGADSSEVELENSRFLTVVRTMERNWTLEKKLELRAKSEPYMQRSQGSRIPTQ